MNPNKRIEFLTVDLSKDSYNPEKNLALAVEYEKLGQTASAVSFYLRAAEYGYQTHVDLTYAALIKVASCIDRQTGRGLTVSNSLLQAVEYLPTRPEAYWALSVFYELAGQWQESYTFASLSLTHNRQVFELPVDVGYHDWYSATFQKAVAAWWVGRKSESLAALRKLAADERCPENYRKASKDNLDRLDIA
jgi:tetratricopeptide (TPR) repeat protein